MTVEIVEDPENELVSAIYRQSGPCLSSMDGYWIPPDPDDLARRIEVSGIKQGWLDVGDVWLGEDRIALAEAFGASRIAASSPDSDVVWILWEDGGITRATELVAARSSKGDVVWLRRAATSEAPCTEPAPALTIPIVQHPREAATAEMSKRGARCFTGSDILKVFQPEKLDTQIDQRGIEIGWLEAGRAWVGEDPAAMMLALGSMWAALGPDQDEVWTVVDRDGRLEARGYRLIETPKGRQVWSASETDREAVC